MFSEKNFVLSFLSEQAVFKYVDIAYNSVPLALFAELKLAGLSKNTAAHCNTLKHRVLLQKAPAKSPANSPAKRIAPQKSKLVLLNSSQLGGKFAEASWLQQFLLKPARFSNFCRVLQCIAV